MDFSKYMKKIREKCSYTQEEASTKIGVSTATIQNWERGTSKPEMSSISSIALAYDVSIDELLKMIALDLKVMENNQDNEVNCDFKYKELFPSNTDYSAIENLVFDKEQQELFLIYSLNKYFGGNPADKMIEYSNSCLNSLLFIENVIEKFNLKDNEKREFVLNKIKQLDGKLFNVYNLDFNGFVRICRIYEVFSDLAFKVRALNDIANCDDGKYCISITKPDDYGCIRERKITTNISRAEHRRHGCYSREELLTFLDKEYYYIEKRECQDEEYLLQKEMYLKKKELYDINKDLLEGLIEPKKPAEQREVYAILTDKAKNLLKVIKENKTFNLQ